MNILGIDYGLKRVGIALAIDKTVVPLETLNNNPLLFDSIINIIESKKISKIIVGNPLLLSGKQGTSVKFVSQFVKRLSSKINLPIELFDERFTSKIANNKLEHINSFAKKQYIDQLSAVEILQSYIGL
jgi:putative Holliday junction resolvase